MRAYAGWVGRRQKKNQVLAQLIFHQGCMFSGGKLEGLSGVKTHFFFGTPISLLRISDTATLPWVCRCIRTKTPRAGLYNRKLFSLIVLLCKTFYRCSSKESRLSDQPREWLPGGIPLSGKRKSTFKRHPETDPCNGSAQTSTHKHRNAHMLKGGTLSPGNVLATEGK